MSLIAIQDGAIEIEASIVAQGLELEPSSVQAMMRAGEITSLSERGVNEDAGRYRLTFFHKSRRFRLIVDESGTIIQRSIINFGDRPLPALMHNRRTKQNNLTSGSSDAEPEPAGRSQQPAADADEPQSGTGAHPHTARDPAARRTAGDSLTVTRTRPRSGAYRGATDEPTRDSNDTPP